MTTSINALHLSRSALGLIELLETKPATRIAAAVKEWNICVDQAGFTGTFDFPTTGYTRKAQLIADLKRCAEQLQAIHTEADRKAGRPVDEEGNDTREWCGNDIEAAHAEALDMNDAYNTLYVSAPGDATRDVWDQLTAVERVVAVDCAHAEALEMEAARNLNARQARFVFHNTAAERAEAIEAAHAEALRMDEKISLCREMAGLTYEQAIAYSDQLDFAQLTPEVQALRIRFDHDTALTMNANYASADQMANEFLIDEAHEEALHMNCLFDALRGRFDLFWSDTVAPIRDRLLATHHENALRINALIDGLVRNIREAMAKAKADKGVRGIAIKVEAAGLELEGADVRFAAETAGRLSGVAA